MALSEEVGATLRVGSRAIFTTSLYVLDLTDEFTFDQDVPATDDNGPSRRMGVDFSGRAQLTKWLTADLDLNYSDNYLTDRFLGSRASSDYYLPLAPVFTSQGGLTARSPSGIKARLGYRAISKRPADQDYSVTALGYYVMDATVAYQMQKLQVSITVENLLNTKWNEAQFATVTQLKGETEPLNQLCFTAGTPIALKFGFSYFF
jgi:outer membrane cobalamin receptor